LRTPKSVFFHRSFFCCILVFRSISRFLIRQTPRKFLKMDIIFIWSINIYLVY
jgi:hypothetical protein